MVLGLLQYENESRAISRMSCEVSTTIVLQFLTTGGGEGGYIHIIVASEIIGSELSLPRTAP